jgi:hypothetical protein
VETCACVKHDDGIIGPGSGNNGLAAVIEAKVVEKAGNGLGDGSQDRARQNVPYDDFGGEEEADIEQMPALV